MIDKLSCLSFSVAGKLKKELLSNMSLCICMNAHVLSKQKAVTVLEI